MAELLEIRSLNAGIEGKELLHDISLSVSQGETHVLMGQNGAGKSTLGSTIMGSPEYKVTKGSIIFDGEDITLDSPDKRAVKGIFMSFQNPVEIPGITLSEFLRNALEHITGEKIKLWDFKKKLNSAMEILDMDRSYADRELNTGFSGGEKKKAEILQLLMLRPRLAILDETDSGLDVDAVKTVSRGIEEYRKNSSGTLIIITHNSRILDEVHLDKTHILMNGRIVKEGDGSLAAHVLENGFEKYINKDDIA